MISEDSMTIYLPTGKAPVWAMPSDVEPPRPYTGRRTLFGGRHGRTPVRDTWTDTVYSSKSKCGKALCDEVGTDKDDHFAWYKLLKEFPNRFEEVGDGDDNDGTS